MRGKEIKRVEFGTKVHKLLTDGISFIEHLSFDSFNENTRLSATLFKAQKLDKNSNKNICNKCDLCDKCESKNTGEQTEPDKLQNKSKARSYLCSF